jgi:hypothetical protein
MCVRERDQERFVGIYRYKDKYKETQFERERKRVVALGGRRHLMAGVCERKIEREMGIHRYKDRYSLRERERMRESEE